MKIIHLQMLVCRFSAIGPGPRECCRRISAPSYAPANIYQFYNSNPDYSGGKYLHLRVNPEIGSINDIGGEDVRYTIKAAHNDNSDQEKPELTIELKDLSDVATKRFYRIRYGD